MSYSALTIADYFLECASKEERVLTPMQLNKLVYLAHGWYLGYTGKPLIKEAVKAWKYGPIVVSVYQKTKKFGTGGVPGLLSPSGFFSSPETLSDEDIPLLSNVWKNYARFSGVELSTLTHTDDSPWAVTWKMTGSKRNTLKEAIIYNKTIADFYKNQINKHQEQASLTA